MSDITKKDASKVQSMLAKEGQDIGKGTPAAVAQKDTYFLSVTTLLTKITMSKGSNISKSDTSRIQSTQAKAGRDTGKNSFSARTQSSADRSSNEAKNAGQQQPQSGNQQQGGNQSSKNN
ncbi:MAG: hypothetical protein EXX96DRAFT_647480 [Benjaminiella poitrasii]|nr:MAG: hypothetical protein EXX96DRAFT_647480 [Benjaminiella poitrasii]